MCCILIIKLPLFIVFQDIEGVLQSIEFAPSKFRVFPSSGRRGKRLVMYLYTYVYMYIYINVVVDVKYIIHIFELRL